MFYSSKVFDRVVCFSESAGKWAYEVLISSQGLMQIGWCTLNCRFNQEVNTNFLFALNVIYYNSGFQVV